MIAPPPTPPDMQQVTPAAHVYADALLRRSITVADRQWTLRYPPACPARVYVYTDVAAGVAARATEPGCDVYFTREYRDNMWRTADDKRKSRRAREHAVSDLCGTSVHERGHNLGLPHGRGTIMDTVTRKAPAACRRWARWVIRRWGR